MDSINAQQKEFEKVCMSMRVCSRAAAASFPRSAPHALCLLTIPAQDVCHSLIGVTKKKRKRRAEDGWVHIIPLNESLNTRLWHKRGGAYACDRNIYVTANGQIPAHAIPCT